MATRLRPLLAFRQALRQLRREPGTAVYAALTLALGLGAATAIYSVMTGFTRPLPIPEGERVVQVRLTDPENGRTDITADDLQAWQESSRSLAEVGAFTTARTAVAAPDRPSRLASGARLTAGAFRLLRVEPLMGRLPSAGPGDRETVVVSFDVWRDRPDRDPRALGTQLRVGDDLLTVIGVMPEGFHFPFHEDLWTVLDPDATPAAPLEIVARLADDADRDEAREELQAILSAHRTAATGTAGTARVEVAGFTEKRGESGETTLLFGLLLLVLALVLVSCSNVSNLLLERAMARARTLSVHQALGAGPGQIVLQCFAEASLVGGMALLPGLVVAYGVIRFIEGTLADHWGYFWMKVALQPSAVLFAGALGVVTALVSGTIPALRSGRTEVAALLSQASHTSLGAPRPRVSRILLTGQVALSSIAVIASVLMATGLYQTRKVVDGFPARSILWSSLRLDSPRYDSAAAREDYRSRLLAGLDEQPGVRRAALSTGLPGRYAPIREVSVAGEADDGRDGAVRTASVTPGFFDLFDLRILRGRDFHPFEDAEPIAVVSEDFVRHRLGGGPAIGRTLQILDPAGESRELRIVGVVDDVVIYPSRRSSHRDFVYVPIDLSGPRELYVTIRGYSEWGERGEHSERRTIAHGLTQASRAADPDVPLDALEALPETLAYVRQFLETLGVLAILGGLGAVAVVAIGLYGIVAYDTRRRLPEVAVRLALGAGTDRILWSVVRQGLLLLLPGVALGLGATYLLTPLLGVFLGSASSHDPRIFAGALAAYLVIALLATVGPARRAAACEPWTILKD